MPGLDQKAYVLAPRLQAVRSQIGRSNNRRVLLLILAFTFCTLEAIFTIRRHHWPEWLIWVEMPIVVFGGMAWTLQINKNPSSELGFVCPLCGKSLYDGADNRLRRRGECPHCKQFVIEKLNEKFA